MKKINFVIFILPLLLIPITKVKAASVAAVATSVFTYEELLGAIRTAKAESKERVEALVEAEKVREAWEIGKLIDEHVLQHKERADYDKQVVAKLAEDLGESETELYYMLAFAREYPIFRPAGKLSWSHYQALLSLNDPKERDEVAKQAAREGWGRDRVREEVRKRQAGKQKVGAGFKPVPAILTATPGKPGTYRIVKAYYGKKPDQLVLDLGFSNYLSVRNLQISTDGTYATGREYKEGDIVTLEKGKIKKLALTPLRKHGAVTSSEDVYGTEIASPPTGARNDKRETQLFTYNATVLKVIDGDTFTAAVDLGFGFNTVQTLRLRGLDAPEVESTSGREAKEFLEKLLPRNAVVLIKTTSSDKYDRYLSDLWIDGLYVNQKLIDEGHAVKVSQ